MSTKPTQLPAVLAEIAQVAGIGAAWALAQGKGGQEIFVPANPSPDHWMSKLVGHDAAVKICAHYRSEHISRLVVPMAARMRRGEAIMRALETGASQNQIAAEHDRHQRTIRRYNRRRKETRRDDLF